MLARDAGSSRRFDDPRRHAGGDHAVRQRVRDDRPGADHRVAADVGQHDRVAADPGAGADADESQRSRLIADRRRTDRCRAYAVRSERARRRRAGRRARGARGRGGSAARCRRFRRSGRRPAKTACRTRSPRTGRSRLEGRARERRAEDTARADREPATAPGSNRSSARFPPIKRRTNFERGAAAAATTMVATARDRALSAIPS